MFQLVPSPLLVEPRVVFSHQLQRVVLNEGVTVDQLACHFESGVVPSLAGDGQRGGVDISSGLINVCHVVFVWLAVRISRIRPITLWKIPLFSRIFNVLCGLCACAELLLTEPIRIRLIAAPTVSAALGLNTPSDRELVNFEFV